MEVVGAETLMGESEVDALNFEGGESGSLADGVAGNAGVAGYGHEVLSYFDLVGRWCFGRRLGGS